MNMEVEILKYVQSFNNPILDKIFLIITMSTEIPVILVLASILYWCINKKYGARLLFALTNNCISSFKSLGVFSSVKSTTFKNS